MNCLEKFEANTFDIVSHETHWNNYVHAVFIDLFLERVGYNLVNWTSYWQNKEMISNHLNSRSPSKEGKILELFVLHYINHVLDFGDNELKIKALVATSDANPHYLTDDSYSKTVLSETDNGRIINNLKTMMKIRGQESKMIWGDNDIIVVLEKENAIQQFCVISCKTSLRERVYQSIFWAMHSRLEGIGKHVFITLDKGASGKSELGVRKEDNSAKKSRDVLESTMDRVYVLRNAEDVNRSQVIKDLNFLRTDLIRWATDIAGD